LKDEENLSIHLEIMVEKELSWKEKKTERKKIREKEKRKKERKKEKFKVGLIFQDLKVKVQKAFKRFFQSLFWNLRVI
jgi:hypothetical protein